uniref:NADH dehydrogenase subunit 6 n=1 Tax=Sypharochiton sinclairi TaxID=1117399 RepID=A0A059U6I3_9MOLL|nr:NADH dehydrogenase subunit 6 [Sypharochiton sinclairi]AHZ60674.1 NADH dehydrogenase subunit 6 [Sypharochiton sinclairi]
MIMMLLFCLVLSITFTLPIIIQPLSMGGLILINSLIMSLCIFYFIESWFGFILFLVYIGGMLVMFAYVTALTPNLVFKSEGVVKFFLFMTSFWVLLLNSVEFFGLNFVVTPWNYVPEVYHQSFGTSLFSFFNFMSLIGLVLILLLILLCVVKICFVNKGPLRPFK